MAFIMIMRLIINGYFAFLWLYVWAIALWIVFLPLLCLYAVRLSGPLLPSTLGQGLCNFIRLHSIVSCNMLRGDLSTSMNLLWALACLGSLELTLLSHRYDLLFPGSELLWCFSWFLYHHASFDTSPFMAEAFLCHKVRPQGQFSCLGLHGSMLFCYRSVHFLSTLVGCILASLLSPIMVSGHMVQTLCPMASHLHLLFALCLGKLLRLVPLFSGLVRHIAPLLFLFTFASRPSLHYRLTHFCFHKVWSVLFTTYFYAVGWAPPFRNRVWKWLFLPILHLLLFLVAVGLFLVHHVAGQCFGLLSLGNCVLPVVFNLGSHYFLVFFPWSMMLTFLSMFGLRPRVLSINARTFPLCWPHSSWFHYMHWTCSFVSSVRNEAALQFFEDSVLTRSLLSNHSRRLLPRSVKLRQGTFEDHLLQRITPFSSPFFYLLECNVVVSLGNTLDCIKVFCIFFINSWGDMYVLFRFTPAHVTVLNTVLRTVVRRYGLPFIFFLSSPSMVRGHKTQVLWPVASPLNIFSGQYFNCIVEHMVWTSRFPLLYGLHGLLINFPCDWYLSFFLSLLDWPLRIHSELRQFADLQNDAPLMNIFLNDSSESLGIFFGKFHPIFYL